MFDGRAYNVKEGHYVLDLKEAFISLSCDVMSCPP